MGVMEIFVIQISVFFLESEMPSIVWRKQKRLQLIKKSAVPIKIFL